MANETGSQKTRARGRLFRALFDARFGTLISGEMVPSIYRFGIMASALTALSVVALAFRFSWQIGLLWAVVLGPVLFLVMVVSMRVALEFVLSMFRMGAELQNVEARVSEVARELRQTNQMVGRIDYNLDAVQRRIAEIQEDIPKIAFWRKGSDRK